MKELSIEEKAKAYDEALKAAVVAHKDEDRHLKATLERIFPVLRESRDEEIWKWLIEVVEEIRKANPTNAEHNGMCSEAITLLEKQGKNPNNVYDKELSEILGCVIRRYINDPNISYTEREKVSREIIPYVERLEKQSEQKTVDKIAKEVCKDKTSAVAFLKSTGIMNENGELADEYKIEQGEKNPAWSKEDEYVFNKILNWCVLVNPTSSIFEELPKDRFIERLKSLKGCGIEFPYFGANYPDARCIDGYLWDMDSGEKDEDGVSYSYGGSGYPCPVCNTKEWLERVMENEEFETEEDALAYVVQLKKKYLWN